jgi:hypothetical protein
MISCGDRTCDTCDLAKQQVNMGLKHWQIEPCSCHRDQGWQGRGVAGVAGRQKVATPAGSRGAAKNSGSLIWIAIDYSLPDANPCLRFVGGFIYRLATCEDLL